LLRQATCCTSKQTPAAKEAARAAGAPGGEQAQFYAALDYYKQLVGE
jgi:hypothetical protein